MTPAQSRIKTWRENPCQFVWDNFKVDPDAWQKEALSVFPSQDPEKKRIALVACTGPGKSALEAWCGWNFLACYGEKYDHPKGAALSISAPNLRDNLWAEFSNWQQRSEFLKEAFEWTHSRIFAKDHPETWFIAARSWSQKADPHAQGAALSGIHAKRNLILIDESGRIPYAIAQKAEQIMSADWAKIIQAGNPESKEGMLYLASSRFRHLWYVIRITADPDDPNRTPRIPIEHAKAQIAAWGRSDPWVKATILGEFPETSINALLGVDEVEAALGRHLTEDKYSFSQKRLGIDVARFGDDRTVIFPRQGLASFNPVVMRNARSDEIAARIALGKSRFKSEMDFIDASGGWGTGVVDACRLAGINLIDVNASGKAVNPKYFNRRAECWWEMAQWIKRGGVLPKLPEMVAELTTPTYTMKEGRLLLEPKERVKARLGRSPDLGDSLSLSFAIPEMPANTGMKLPTRNHNRDYDYDPFHHNREASQ